MYQAQKKAVGRMGSLRGHNWRRPERMSYNERLGNAGGGGGGNGTCDQHREGRTDLTSVRIPRNARFGMRPPRDYTLDWRVRDTLPGRKCRTARRFPRKVARGRCRESPSPRRGPSGCCTWRKSRISPGVSSGTGSRRSCSRSRTRSATARTRSS